MKHSSLLRSPGRWLLGALIFLATPVALAAEAREWTDSERLSYALGMDLGLQMRRHGINLNPSVFASGLIAGLAEDDSVMTPWDVKAVIGQLQQELKRRQAEALAQESARGQDGTPASASPAGPPAAISPAAPPVAPPAATSSDAAAAADKPAN